MRIYVAVKTCNTAPPGGPREGRTVSEAEVAKPIKYTLGPRQNPLVHF